MRSAPSELYDASHNDEKSTSAWMITAVVALVVLLILLVLASGVGAWISMRSSFFGDQTGTASGSGYDSEESGAGSTPDTASEALQQEAEATSSNPSLGDAPRTVDSAIPSVDANASLAENAQPPEDIPVVGNETPSSISGDSARDENGPSVAGGSFFGLRADGKRFVYVVDCSGSMTGPPYQRATMELLSSIANLEKSQQFFIILFSTESYPMFHPLPSQEFLYATDDALKQTKVWLKGFSQGQGGTNPEPALEQALAMKPDAIFFLTDGAIPPTTPGTIRSSNGRKTPVHAIGFVNRAGEDVLKQIADESRGQYKFVP